MELNADIPKKQGYASALKKNTPKPPIQHQRPRSLFIRGSEDLDYDEICAELEQNEISREYINKIEGCWETRRGMWIMTFFKDKQGTSIRDALYEKIQKQCQEGPSFGKFRLELPRPPAEHIIANGIPTETEKQAIIQEINSQGFGKVVSITRVFRRNTNIYNGRTNIWIESFEKEKMPYQLYIDGYLCQLRTAEDIYRRKCYLCNMENHVAKNCPKIQETCKNCAKAGHTTEECNAEKPQPQPQRQRQRERLVATREVIDRPAKEGRQTENTIKDWFDLVEAARKQEKMTKTKTSGQSKRTEKPTTAPKSRKIQQLKIESRKDQQPEIEDSPASPPSDDKMGDPNPRIVSENAPLDLHNETIIDQDSLMCEHNKRPREPNSSNEIGTEKKSKQTDPLNYETDDTNTSSDAQ